MRLRGVCGTLFNSNKQMIGVQLFVPSMAFIDVVEPAATDPFAGPTQPIGLLLRWTGQQSQGHRVHIGGEITWRSGAQLTVRDAHGNATVTHVGRVGAGRGRRLRRCGRIPGDRRL